MRVRTWTEVPLAFREWEKKISEYESLTGGKLDDSIRTHSLLELLPQDLKNLAQSQVHLDQNYASLRDYVLNQTGRRSVEARSKINPNDMDLNLVDTGALDHTTEQWDSSTIEHDAFWWGKKGRSKGGGKIGTRIDGKMALGHIS